ncbi:hypothetical protein ACFL3E_01950 [Patescibacteria group bacterium]
MNSKKGIINLAVVFGIGLFALTSALTVSTNTLSELNKNRNTTSGNQSFYTAESATSEGVYQLINEITYIGGDAELLNNTQTGAIIITDHSGPYIEVQGTADTFSTHREVASMLTTFPEGEAFNHALYVDGELNFGGNSQVNGNVWSNDDLSLSGSALIDGDAFTATQFDPADPASLEAYITGFFGIADNPIPPPQIDSLYYKNNADTIINEPQVDKKTKNHLKFGTVDEIVFVDNPTELLSISNANFKGTLVVSGNLKLTGGTYATSSIRTTPHPTMIVEGDLDIMGGATINGIIFVKGVTNFSGNNTVNGTIVSEGGINSPSGGSVINFVKGYVKDWFDMGGVDTGSSSQPPKVISWGEL